MLCTLCINSRGYGLAPSDDEPVALDEPTQQPAQPPSTPGPPVAECDRGIYVTLEWTQADDDGGTDITGYVIKYRGRPRPPWYSQYSEDDGRLRWYRHSEDDVELTDDDNCSPVNVDGNTPQFQFTDELEEQTRYQFAVAAVNAAGQGQFSLFSDDVYTDQGEHCSD